MRLNGKEIKNTDDHKIKVRFLLFVGVMIFVPIIAIMILDWFINNDQLTVGISGYIQNAVIYSMLAGFSIFIAIGILFRLVRERKGFKKTSLSILGIIILSALSFFLIKPVISDVFYLHDPLSISLYRLSFADEWGIGDSPVSYYLEGYDMTNNYRSFRISKDLYDKGKTILQDGDLYAKVAYLPNTGSVIELTLLTDFADIDINEDSPIIDEDWRSYALSINGIIYELPVSLDRFIENGWHIEEDESVVLKGNDEAYGSYDYKRIHLISDSDQMLSAVVYNTGEDDIALKDGIIGGLSMIYGNYDYAPKGNILPGGLYLGISTYDDVLASYGTPSESYERSLTYRNENGSYWVLWFDNDDHLDEIIVHHQPYYRSY